MHRIQYFLLSALLLCAIHIQAQTASGHLSDKSTGKPIAYANVGLPYKNMGTTTNELGYYTLPMPGTSDSDIVKISIIGYQAQTATVKYLLNHPDIYLQPQNNDLKEVVIKQKKLKHNILGNTTNNKNANIGFNSYKLGYEIGTLMKIKRKPTYIDSVRINIAHTTADTIFLRLNIAEEVDGEFNNILDTPIYINIAAKAAMDRLVIDLTPYHIIAHHNFMVSVELVKNLYGKEIFLCAALLGHPAYIREVSQAPWEKIAMAGPAISTYVTY